LKLGIPFSQPLSGDLLSALDPGKQGLKPNIGGGRVGPLVFQRLIQENKD